MTEIKSIRRIFVLFALLLASGLGWAQADQSEYKLGAGDAIRVLVYQNPDMTLETRVSEAGAITYPLIGQVEIGGLSISAAESKIAKLLVDGGFMQKPQINIVLLQIKGNQVTVLGQVNHPGRFPLDTSNIHVSDVMALAGGTTPQGSDVAILTGTRNGKAFRKEVDIPSLYKGKASDDDIVVLGGDSIFVDRAPQFYVYGEVQRPGPYILLRGMTVMQALSTGGGLTPRGTDRWLRIQRRGPDGKVKEISVDLTDLVQAEDIIQVRESLF